MRVQMLPAMGRNADNPFLSILGGALAEQGVQIEPFSPLPMSRPQQALHIHWLEAIFWGRLSSRSIEFARWSVDRLVAQAKRYRDAGRPVVWTVHNLAPHDSMSSERREVLAQLRARLLPLVTDVVSMTEAAVSSIRAGYPEVRAARLHVIPHPHYRSHFAQHRFAPPEDLPSPYVLVFGQVRRYKGIVELVEMFREIASSTHLVIVGDGDQAYCDELAAAIRGSSTVQFRRARVDDASLAGYVSGAALTIFNFTEILNSGSVLTSLSLGTPVVCPATPVFQEMSERTGGGFSLYDGKLTGQALSRILVEREREPRPIDLSAFEPKVVAQGHLAVYSASD